MGKFKDLIVWQKSKDLCILIYKITNSDLFSKDFGLKDQIRRAAVSIVSNIAEGDESGSNKNCVRYFNISKASVAEVYTQIIIAHEIGYVDNESFFKIENACKELGAMLYKLIEKRKQC